MKYRKSEKEKRNKYSSYQYRRYITQIKISKWNNSWRKKIVHSSQPQSQKDGIINDQYSEIEYDQEKYDNFKK
jgi:hypothetical protein